MGAACGAVLASEGCRVAVVALNQEGIEHAVETVRSAGGMAIGISADLSTTVGITAAVESVRSAFGPPEIVVAQTNDLTTGNFFDLSDEDLRSAFQILPVSLAALARAVLPDMRAAGLGERVHSGWT